MAERTDTLQLDEDNPWPGLAAYDESAQRFFHGRDADTAELLRLIRLSPIVTLYGKSGLGKSSMLQAGLFPQLRALRFLPVHLRLDYSEGTAQAPMAQAAQRLRQEIVAAGLDGAPFEPGETLWAYLQRIDRPIWTTDNYPITPVLVFDQFEEVFSRGGAPAHVKAQLDAMADLVADRLPATLAEDRDGARRLNLQSQQYRVVLSFRSDFLADVESWEKQANLPRHESLHLTAMSRERAIEAVEAAGAKVVEPGVAAQIVDFLLQREGLADGARATEVEPVLLSLCCYQLNRRRQRPGRIDSALLHTVGEGILQGFYDEALKGMPSRVSTFIEDNLIQGDRYRNSYALDEALSSGALTENELDQLTNSRLLRVDPQGEVPRIELIHDRLVGIVREARDTRRASETRQREREAADRRAHEERERERLAQSERERRRVARWRNGLAVAVVMLLVAAGWAVYFALGKTAAIEIANARADEAAAVAGEAARARATALEELDKVKKVLAVLQRANNEQTEMANAPVQARAVVTDKAQAATRAALETVKTAEQQIAAGASGGTPGAAAAPSRPGAEVPPVAAASAAAAPMQGLNIADWRLSSGGCLKGDVTVYGTANFQIEPAGGSVVVREVFTGGNPEFKVTVRGEARLPRNGGGHYDVPTTGQWQGRAGRRFSSSGVDRVFTRDGLTPVSAAVMRFRTVCSD